MSPSAALPCGALSSISTRSNDCRPCVVPVADSGRLRSESTPVSWTPGARLPLTARSSDWRRKASWLEPKSTASVLLPLTTRAAPEGAASGSRAVAGRAATAPRPAPGERALSAAAALSGRPSTTRW